MAHLRIDGHEMSINELNSWVRGFITLHHKGMLRRTKLPRDLKAIMKDVPIDDEYRHNWWGTFELHWNHAAWREEIEKRIDHYAAYVDEKIDHFLDEEEMQEEVREEAADESQRIKEIKGQREEDRKDDSVRRARKHSTLHLRKKEFERYEKTKEGERGKAIPENHPVKKAFAEFVKRHLPHADKLEDEKQAHPIQSADETKPDAPDSKKKPDSATVEDAAPDPAQSVMAYLQENNNYMGKFIQIVREGMTELAIQKFSEAGH